MRVPLRGETSRPQTNTWFRRGGHFFWARALFLLRFFVLRQGEGFWAPSPLGGWGGWSRMNSQSPCSWEQEPSTASARRSRVDQSRDHPWRARKRTIWALWRGSVRMQQEAWEAERRVERQATTRRVSRPTVDSGRRAAAKKPL